MRSFGFLLVFLMLFSSPAGSAKEPAPAGEVLYSVQKGDNLYVLAENHFRRIDDYVVVQRLNRIRDPRRIPVDRILRIPRKLLKHEPVAASILSFRGNVGVIRNGRNVPITTGAVILEGDEISTAANSFVSVGMPDGSAVALPSQSRVTVRRLQKITLTGAVERLFAVQRGRARAVVSPLDENDEFHLSTPIAVSAVRGTEFRVSYSAEDARSTTETLSGEVTMAGADEDLRTLPAGFGAIASRIELSPAIPLLPAPRLAVPGKVQDEHELVFESVPLPGAMAYRVQIALDAGFLEVVGEAVSVSSEVHLSAVPDGTWFARISAIDANGLEGRYETYSFQRRLNRIEASVDTSEAGRYKQYLFRWDVEGAGDRQYRVQVALDEAFQQLVVDEPGLTARRFIITDLPSGTYYWRVETLQFVDGEALGKWSPVERLTISADQ